MVEFFSAITSHQAYWHSLEFAKFVLHIIHTVGEEENTPTDDVGGAENKDDKGEVEDNSENDKQNEPSKL